MRVCWLPNRNQFDEHLHTVQQNECSENGRVFPTLLETEAKRNLIRHYAEAQFIILFIMPLLIQLIFVYGYLCAELNDLFRFLSKFSFVFGSMYYFSVFFSHLSSHVYFFMRFSDNICSTYVGMQVRKELVRLPGYTQLLFLY